MMPRHFLFAAEDPGAANFMAPIAQEMQFQGDKVTVLSPAALDYYWGQISIFPLAVDFDLFDWSDYDALLVGTSENKESRIFKLMAQAQNLKLPVIGCVDGPANVMRRFQGQGDDPLTHKPDYLLVPDQQTAQAFTRLGFEEADVAVVGYPQFDKLLPIVEALNAEGKTAVRERVFGAEVGNRPVVVFCSELSNGLSKADFVRSENYSLKGWGASDRRTDIVLETVLDGLKESNTYPYVVMRLHPKEQAENYQAYAPWIDLFHQGGRAYDILFAADYVVGMTSIVLHEAAMMGCPTLAVLPRREEQSWLGSIAQGLTDVVFSEDECTQWFLENQRKKILCQYTVSVNQIMSFLEKKMRQNND